jgi:hypothetical protein
MNWGKFTFVMKFCQSRGCPSPDGRGYPFVPGFGIKDMSNSRNSFLKSKAKNNYNL